MTGFSIGADLFPVIAAVLCAVTCAVLGNFLVLRRQALMGDAISHAVLPGLVIAFLVTSSRDSWAMLAGALVAGIVTVVLIEVVHRAGRVESGAAMGVVFSVLFAIGIVGIERASSLQHLDIDADCVLHGQLETTFAWFGAPTDARELLDPGAWRGMPGRIWTLLSMCAVSCAFVAVFFKELRLAAFDPALSSSMGFSARGLNTALLVLVACAAVVSFEAVGSILVIAMLICPASTARLLTDRVGSQVVVSVVVALASTVLGYVCASAVPGAFGLDAVNAAGSMTVMSGVVLAIAIVAAPRHGVAARWIRRRSLARVVGAQDLLAGVYRAQERGTPDDAAGVSMGEAIGLARHRGAIGLVRRRGLVRVEGGRVTLTDDGRRRAQALVRRHRLWESYLVDSAGVSEDHVHETAEVLEHLGFEPGIERNVDPHGRSIPGAEEK